MSLLRYLLDERPVRTFGDIYDQHFGMGLFDDEDLFEPSRLLLTPLRSGYIRPWRRMTAKDSGVSHVTLDKSGLKVQLDVQHFKPEELNVKVVDNYFVIEGKHEEKTDEHGYVARQFTRRYKIPEGVNPDKLTSKLSSDGLLMLEAPTKESPKSKERVVQITQTKVPAVKEKEAKSVEKMDDN